MRPNFSRQVCIGRSRRPALTIVEASISTLIVGVMLVAALETVGATRTGRVSTSDRALGQLLAQQLMSEILRRPYEDPNEANVFGSDPGDAPAIRAGLDDVDDFDARVESPPKYADGTSLTGLDGWSREVVVDWVGSSDHTKTSLVETGVKRVTVSVFKNSILVGSLTALRTASGDTIAKVPQ